MVSSVKVRVRVNIRARIRVRVRFMVSVRGKYSGGECPKLVTCTVYRLVRKKT